MFHEAAQSTPRARRRDANHLRILEAAMALVAEGGLEALSMARLAEAADYTPGALYRYFPNKDALLAALVGQVLDELQVFLMNAEGALKAPSPLARIFALAHGYRRFGRTKPHAFGFLASTIAEPRVLLDTSRAAPVAERAITVLELLAQALNDAVKEGALEPAPDDGELERTIILFAQLQGLLQLQKQARFSQQLVSLSPLVTQAVRALLLGWGAARREVDAAFHSLSPGATA